MLSRELLHPVLSSTLVSAIHRQPWTGKHGSSRRSTRGVKRTVSTINTHWEHGYALIQRWAKVLARQNIDCSATFTSPKQSRTSWSTPRTQWTRFGPVSVLQLARVHPPLGLDGDRDRRSSLGPTRNAPVLGIGLLFDVVPDPNLLAARCILRPSQVSIEKLLPGDELDSELATSSYTNQKLGLTPTSTAPDNGSTSGEMCADHPDASHGSNQHSESGEISETAPLKTANWLLTVMAK